MKVHVITLGYCPARILRGGLEKFRRTRAPDLEFTHYFVDQHYPLRREENLENLRSVCKEFGLVWLDSGGDVGLHAGLNFACEQIKPGPGDVILTFDPDSGPTDIGWDAVLVAAIRGGYSIASLGEPRAMSQLIEYGYAESMLGKVRIWDPKRAVVMSVSAWSWDFLRAIGGFYEHLKYYGGLESAMWERLHAFGGKWAYLPDFGEENSLREEADIEYTSWKWSYCHHGSFPGSFQEYIDAGFPGMNETPKVLP